ncbi:MAG: hypothetical protein EOP23_08920 [Hyphomicrobiales bacterium]|nr:MAG: hypothetical protein EOP23_08920 [Hyphomicrobiales bacterium]
MPSTSPAEPGAARAERLSPGGGLLVGLVCLLVSFGALASLPGPTDGSEPVAIVFPPWTDGAEAVALSFAAGHRVLRSGRFSAVVVVAPTLNGKARSLPKGAWFSLVLAGLAGCLDSSGRTEPTS